MDLMQKLAVFVVASLGVFFVLNYVFPLAWVIVRFVTNCLNFLSRATFGMW